LQEMLPYSRPELVAIFCRLPPGAETTPTRQPPGATSTFSRCTGIGVCPSLSFGRRSVPSWVRLRGFDIQRRCYLKGCLPTLSPFLLLLPRLLTSLRLWRRLSPQQGDFAGQTTSGGKK